MSNTPLFFIVFWALFAIAITLFGLRIFKLLSWILMGTPEDRFDNPVRRLKQVLSRVLTQVCSLKSVTKKDFSGIGHALLFWGFLIFLLYYLIYIFIGDGLGLSASIKANVFSNYFFLFVDLAGVMVTIAIIWAGIRRHIIKPERLETTAEAAVILILIFSLMLMNFIMEGFYINSAPHSPVSWMPIGSAFATVFNALQIGSTIQGVLYNISWWVHYLLIIGFLVFIVFSKHLHILTSPVNIFFSSSNPRGALTVIDINRDDPFGVSRIDQYSWKHLLDLLSCTKCGLCQINCPAQISGKTLNPKKIIHDLRDNLEENGSNIIKHKHQREQNTPMVEKKPLIGDVITEDAIWACTTCYACQDVCPVNIEQMSKIIELRRNLVEQGHIASATSRSLESTKTLGNPWEYQPDIRTDWAKNSKVHILNRDEESELLFWVGCTGSYDLLGQKITIAMVSIMESAGIQFGILKEEKCCGSEARRIGEEGLFQTLATDNIRIFNKHKVKKIITCCPHGYNTFKNEYPKFGGNFEVVHHSQFLDELILQGKIKPKRELKEQVVYHDPCYLGRYNNIFDAPRRVIKSIPRVELVELDHNLNRAICCGGGGGQLWIESSGGDRINYIRFKDVEKAHVSIVVTACPLCKVMFDDAATHANASGNYIIKDIAELINESI